MCRLRGRQAGRRCGRQAADVCPSNSVSTGTPPQPAHEATRPGSRQRRGHLQRDPVDRAAHERACLQRAAQHHWREVAEVGGDRRDGLVELLVRPALPRVVGRGRHRDHAVGDLPAVRALPQSGAHALLGRRDERRRQVAALDAGGELDAVPDRRRLDAQPEPGEVGVAPTPMRSVDAPAPIDPLDADRRGVEEAHGDAIALLQQRGRAPPSAPRRAGSRPPRRPPRRGAGRSAGPRRRAR